ncbi:patatin-like phospholipase domain-containing protein 4 isoform X2 [Buteo buteo]|uniref:patatin-like phospholipase domain-containing protein 4 isoform X2 n=1 Tax=Buteo buteo TaxID=30397 RepID=UPI003EB8992D
MKTHTHKIKNQLYCRPEVTPSATRSPHAVAGGGTKAAPCVCVCGRTFSRPPPPADGVRKRRPRPFSLGRPPEEEPSPSRPRPARHAATLGPSRDLRREDAAPRGRGRPAPQGEGIESILPSNAHEIAENRLYVSVTNTKSGENHLVSNFASREDLIKVLLASSFVPVYAGIKPVEYKGEKWVDGGLTNGLPILPVGRTVTISPFSGRLDICPQDKGRVDLYVKFAKQDIMLSLANLVRLNQALFPPNQEKMELLYQNGFDDAVRFLLKENWFE